MACLIKDYRDRIKHIVKSTFITSNRIKLSSSSIKSGCAIVDFYCGFNLRLLHRSFLLWI